MPKPGLLTKVFEAFRHDRRGNFGVMLAATGSLLALAAGFALNTAQIVLTKSDLLNALDSAITSTARDLTTGVIAEEDAHDTIMAFLLANGDSAFASAGEIRLDRIEIDKVANIVSAQASVDLDMLFPLFGTANRQTVTTESAAQYSDKRIEIAMMLDVTGSMKGGKLQSLKQAASGALDTFLKGQRMSGPRVRVALVPYAQAVNVGSLSNMVYAEGGYTSGDENPPKLDDPRAVGGRGSTDDCATERKGDHQFTDASPSAAMVNRDYRLKRCPSAELIPLSADLDRLEREVRSFTADGNTAGHIGIQWSWYMLSHEWAPVLPRTARPERADPKEVAKYAILMTDGEFNTAYAGVQKDGVVTRQEELSGEHAETLCEAMKKDGIEIFTVGFMLDEDSAKQMLANCATRQTGATRYYYDAATGDELVAAFEEIARNIESLAVIR